ncbi:hypothetical protein H6P81_006735 [Aristolochia fimbriata]|uniref:Membrane-associated kinase regulator 4 n=1 Tax=Aristolochia fimbriata TaxID=158543 RepID=A0AAV7EZD6_ARIFI|nr:hypothetical protein H6P81_006735 [Aristolochia fimbriata]
MARDLVPCDQVEEEYIEMDVSSSSFFFCYSPQSRDFEFQMSSKLPERDQPTTSPADELFYKGKLLPLHLPPRLQMVQKLLRNPPSCNSSYQQNVDSLEQSYVTATATPYESCNISPADSCPVSRELNPDEYLYECGPDDTSFINHPKKSWSKKLKLIKQSSLSHKLRASRAYLKSFFTKSGCTDESSTDAAKIIEELPASKAAEPLNKYIIKVAKRNPFGQIHRERHQANAAVLKDIQEERAENNGSHRRSFSGAIKRNLAAKSPSSSSSSSSSFSSVSSNGLHGVQMLKRSSSVNSEVESSIQGAIAHCKQSQLQLFSARKRASEVGFCSLSASRIVACEYPEWPGMCRG